VGVGGSSHDDIVTAISSTIVAAVATSGAPPTAATLRQRLAGRLVVVEPLAAAHEPGLIDAASEPELFRWMPVDMASSPDAVRRWLEAALEAANAGHEVPFAILDAGSGQVIGSTRFLELRLEHLRVEIGWTWLARPAWSTGANVETKLLLLGQALERTRCRRVEFKTDARNERSRGALLALGARFEGILRKHMVVRDGGARDSAYYSVIDDDWPALKPRLERRRDEHLARRARGT
jgi:RimJ/RimL family protein N-acetyltransferase